MNLNHILDMYTILQLIMQANNQGRSGRRKISALCKLRNEATSKVQIALMVAFVEVVQCFNYS